MKKVIICITACSLLAFGAIVAAKHILRKDDNKEKVDYISEEEITGI